jgi:hypothetical protein
MHLSTNQSIYDTSFKEDGSVCDVFKNLHGAIIHLHHKCENLFATPRTGSHFMDVLFYTGIRVDQMQT